VYLGFVTRDEAEAECRRLAAESPDRNSHRWFPQAQANGGWAVVKVQVPEGTRTDPLREETRADEKPPTADDPRTSYARNVGSDWVG
jgi:hypothetical protein